MEEEEIEAYLRKHTLIGQWGELHDAVTVLAELTVYKTCRQMCNFLLKLLNILGI